MIDYMGIAEKIKEADGILIGASNGLSISEGYHIFANDERFRSHFSDFQKKYGFQSLIQGSFAGFESENEMWSFFSRSAYYYMYNTESSSLMQQLHELVREKPHFVVTSNADDHFSMAGFDDDCLFEIEGNMKHMQCLNGCHDKIYSSREAVLEMRKHENGMEIPSEYLPKCPVCGGPMHPHVPLNQVFVRNREWKASMKAYNDFIDRFHNRNLLILELGIGARNQMIKAPLMQLTYSEPNASYITFNKGEVYIHPQIMDKSIGVDGDLSEIIPKLLECLKEL